MKLYSPSAARNRAHILPVLRDALPADGSVLEVASGSGEHAVHFTAALPHRWQPSDVDPEALASIEAWRAEVGHPGLLPPLRLDVLDPETWPEGPFDAVVCSNMIHITPWACCLGLLDLAARVLPAAGVLFLYGPYLRGGKPTTASNADFDASLKARDRSWGLRDLGRVRAAAAGRGLLRTALIDTPHNNFSQVFVREGSPDLR